MFQAVGASSVTTHEELPENLNIAQADPVGHGMAVSLSDLAVRECDISQ